MSVVMIRGIHALFVYLLICLLVFIAGAMVIELAVNPLIAWLHGYKAYYSPTMSRVFAWCKFILFASIVCGTGAWLYDRHRLGR
jgi:hypothetical protein